MRFAVLADIHGRHQTEADERPIEGLPAPIHDLNRLFTALGRTVVEERLDAVFIAGDLTHHKKLFPVETIVAIIRLLATIKVPKYILAGNHDLADNLHRISALEAVPGIQPVLQPWDTYFGTGADRLFVRWVPYDRDERKMMEAMTARHFTYGAVPAEGMPTPSTPTLLITHGTFQDGRLGPWDYAVKSSGISLDTVSTYRCTIAGHLHTHQILQRPGMPTTISKTWDKEKGALKFVPGQGSVIYTGTPYPHNAAHEPGDIHGFWVVDTKTWEFSLRRVPGPVYATVRDLAETEALLAKYDPSDINLKSLLSSGADAKAIGEIGAACRSYSAPRADLSHGMVPLEARQAVAAAADEGDEALLRAYLQAISYPPADIDYTLAVGLEGLRRV